MGSKSRALGRGPWHADVRAKKDHEAKKAARKQRQHLETIKTPEQLRAILLGSRFGWKNKRGA